MGAFQSQGPPNSFDAANFTVFGFLTGQGSSAQRAALGGTTHIETVIGKYARPLNIRTFPICPERPIENGLKWNDHKDYRSNPNLGAAPCQLPLSFSFRRIFSFGLVG